MEGAVEEAAVEAEAAMGTARVVVDVTGGQAALGASASPSAHSAAEGGDGATAPECDLDVISASSLSPEEFVMKYALQGRPVVVSGATEGWPALQNLGRDEFLGSYGQAKWQPQYLLPGNITVLEPYLRQAAEIPQSKHHRPISFNRPTDISLLRAMQSQAR